MNLDQFMGRLEADNAGKRGTHKLGKPLTDAELARWQKKHPEIALPEDYLALLRRANGLTVHPEP